MGIKAVPSLAVLAILGSYATQANAQGIQGDAPLSVNAGATSSTYLATVTMSPPSGYTVRLKVYKNGVLKHNTVNVVPNPGVSPTTFTKGVNMSTWGVTGGDLLDYFAQLYIGGVLMGSHHLYVTVSGGTRPTTRVDEAPVRRNPARLLIREEEGACA
jgi:hypothetical protein